MWENWAHPYSRHVQRGTQNCPVTDLKCPVPFLLKKMQSLLTEGGIIVWWPRWCPAVEERYGLTGWAEHHVLQRPGQGIIVLSCFFWLSLIWNVLLLTWGSTDPECWKVLPLSTYLDRKEGGRLIGFMAIVELSNRLLSLSLFSFMSLTLNMQPWMQQ